MDINGLEFPYPGPGIYNRPSIDLAKLAEGMYFTPAANQHLLNEKTVAEK